MLKARADGALLFGLSARNVELLMEGRPIRVDLREMGVKCKNAETLVLFYGRDEGDLVRQLLSSGVKPLIE